MTIPAFEEIIEPNDQTEARREHLENLRELIGNAYPNKFERSAITGGEDTIAAIKSFQTVVDIETEMALVKAGLKDGERPPSELKEAINERLKQLGTVRIAGRLTTPPRGNFVHLTDGIGKLQIYCKKGQFTFLHNGSLDSLDSQDSWSAWGMIDHGDFVGVEGYLFVTNTGEVSVHVEKLQFLAKAMLPMPDKMHGIADPEIRQRQRYADLIASSLQVETDGLTTRQVFETRAKVISSLRHFLEDNGYIEVETPMLTPKATGAAAKPFKTHHKALDIDLYARIAPELYLKRLVVGGFEKVYELNRNFRNEGISYKHNPEFTMLEFYCAYMDVEGMMNFCEELMRQSVQKAASRLSVVYEDNEIDFSRFERITMVDAVKRITPLLSDLIPAPEVAREAASKDDWVYNRELVCVLSRHLRKHAAYYDAIENRIYLTGTDENGKMDETPWLHRRHDSAAIEEYMNRGYIEHQMARDPNAGEGALADWSNWREEFTKSPPTEEQYGQAIIDIFESEVERTLISPTFVTSYPKSISPLSKASPENPNIAERFELFINGMEVANGFSELNDPKEQYDRFVDQMSERERGDEEAMILDEDYIRALSYGMPPAAGIGIGIDRLVMLLTNKHSIRDVILFPHMRPERRSGEEEEI